MPEVVDAVIDPPESEQQAAEGLPLFKVGALFVIDGEATTIRRIACCPCCGTQMLLECESEEPGCPATERWLTVDLGSYSGTDGLETLTVH